MPRNPGPDTTTTPDSAVPRQPGGADDRDRTGGAGLLDRMEELMAALTADLSRLDADLQSTATRLQEETGRLDPEPPGGEATP